MVFWVASAAARLVEHLTSTDEPDVLDFCREFDRKMDEAFTWELWGVAYIVNGVCDDDSFLDFRSSLVAQGQAIYENAIADPESLVLLDKFALDGMFEEGYLYAPATAYEQPKGTQPDTGLTRKSAPSETEWNESLESLARSFPRAWAVYGWEATQPQPLTAKKSWWKIW
jgi:hypothetical protein